MRLALHGLLVFCVLTAGCISGVPGGFGGSPTPPPEPTPVVALTDTATACDDALSIAFWGLSGENFWSQDTVRVGYRLPANTSVLLVTYIDGTVQDVTSRTTDDSATHADGDELTLDGRFSGTHVVRTVVYRDTNRDGQLQQDVDAPCTADGELVQAGPTRVDFDRF